MCDYTYHRDKQIIIFHNKNEAITDSDSGCAIVVECVSGVHWIDANDGHYLCISESLCRDDADMPLAVAAVQTESLQSPKRCISKPF